MALYPVSTQERTSGLPVANVAIIAINVVVFLFEIVGGDPFVSRWSFTPAAFTAFLNGSGSFESVITIFTSMFMHGGLAHIAGNMLFLWVFGQATEDAFGSRPYTIFYLTCGIAANVAQYLTAPGSTVPNLGASGAIAGVMGAYLAMYPDSKINIFAWPLSLFLRRDLQVPAWVMLGLWFGSQLVSGIGGLSSAGADGGVAYMAHVGGFVTGFVLAVVIQPGRRSAVAQGRPREAW